MKNFKRIIALALAVLMAATLFVSCNNGDVGNEVEDNNSQTTVDSPEKETPSEIYFDMVDEDGNVCYIVYPEGASEKVIELANKLSTRLKTTLGKKIPPVICENEMAENSGSYICIGEIGLECGVEFLGSLKYSDIGFKVFSSDILVVSAHTEEYLEDAIKIFSNTFNKSILDTKPMSDGSEASGRFYPASSSKTKVEDYKVSAIELDGVDVSEYKIIYASENEKEAAYAIRDSIGKACGAVLTVAPQSDDELANEILVGPTDRALSKKYEALAQHNYKIAIESGKMVVVAPHEILMGGAIDYIETTLLSVAEAGSAIALTAENDVLGTTTVESFDLVGKDDGDIRILSSNLYFESQTRARAAKFLYTVPLYDADVICLQEMDSTWHLLLDAEIPKLGYTAVPTLGSGEYESKKHADNYTPIYYRADRYKLIDCGYQPYASVKDTKESVFVKYPELAKLNDAQKQNVLKEYIRNGTTYSCVAHLSKSFSWAVLESLETGERFGVLSSHMTHDNSSTVSNVRRMYDTKEAIAKIRELESAYDIPVMIVGDFNFNSNETPYRIFKEEGFTDSFYSCELRESFYTGHTLGEMPKDLTGLPIDMCFHTDGIDANKLQIVVNEHTVYYSDHFPITFDFSIK